MNPKADPIEQFFDFLTARDWEGLGGVLAPDVERVGPFGDRVVGRTRYLDFLAGVVPADYRNDVVRITYAPDRRSGFGRVTEHLGYPDRELHLEEVYSFTLDEDGVIAHIEIFWQHPDAEPEGFGSATSPESYASDNRDDALD